MKKIFVVFLAALALTGCAAGKQPVVTEAPTQSQTQGSQPAGTEQASEPVREEAAGFTIPFRGTDITLGTPMEPVLAALGEPTSYTEQTSCAFQGLDKTYYYGSLYIQTNPAPEGDRIAAVWFADDSITTAEGVYIGADRATVEKAYGSFSGDACALDRDGQRLMILLESGVVSSIQYTLAQE